MAIIMVPVAPSFRLDSNIGGAENVMMALADLGKQDSEDGVHATRVLAAARGNARDALEPYDKWLCKQLGFEFGKTRASEFAVAKLDAVGATVDARRFQDSRDVSRELARIVRDIDSSRVFHPSVHHPFSSQDFSNMLSTRSDISFLIQVRLAMYAPSDPRQWRSILERAARLSPEDQEVCLARFRSWAGKSSPAGRTLQDWFTFPASSFPQG